MKPIVILLMLTLLGCAQLMKGDLQPVISLKGGDMFTTCSGAVEDWSSCNAKARRTCPTGYELLKRDESPVGGKRELTFRCK